LTADELRDAFAKLPPLIEETRWDRNRAALRKHVENDDLDDFLNWSTIQATMFVGEAPYIKTEYESLTDGTDFWQNAIQEPGIGNPSRLSYAPHTSGNLVNQAYHLKQWTDRAVIEVSDLETVYEVGAGYGAMTVVLNQLGFDGDYYTYDLPEFDLLRSYYLSQVGIKPNGGQPDPLRCDLMIALFSVDEMPLDDRQIFLEVWANSYLIAFHSDWGGVDNDGFFGQLVDGRPDLEWDLYPSPKSYWYLVGV